jgi:hypothetical protein
LATLRSLKIFLGIQPLDTIYRYIDAFAGKYWIKMDIGGQKKRALDKKRHKRERGC